MCEGVREEGGRPPGRGKRRVPAVHRHHPPGPLGFSSCRRLSPPPVGRKFTQELLPPTARGHDLFRPWAARPAKKGSAAACRALGEVCFQLSRIFNSLRGLPKGGHYSTRTVNATSEDSQQGWCGCLCGLEKGWLCGSVRQERGGALGREAERRVPRRPPSHIPGPLRLFLPSP